MIGIMQSHTIENLMPATDNTIPIAIVKPKARIDVSACMVGIGFGVREERRSGGSIHNIVDAEQGVLVPQTAHSLSRVVGQNLGKSPGFWGNVRRSGCERPDSPASASRHHPGCV